MKKRKPTKSFEVTEINKPFLRMARPIIEEALKEAAEKLGVQLTLGSCRFSPSNARFKLELAIKTNGTVLTKEVTDFKLMCKLYGLQESDLGKVFTTFDGDYKITGLKPRARRYPILAEKVGNGKRYKFAAVTVQHALKAGRE